MHHVIVKRWPGKSDQKAKLAEQITQAVVSTVNYGEEPVAQFNAVAIALREKGLLGTQEETVVNEWTGTTRTVVNAVWLTAAGRQSVNQLE